ncbi:MAG: cupin, partial [Chloroflexi bacterium]|nr:cupin [Chloroflexota bacterium]
MPKPEFEFFDPEEMPWQPIEGTPGLSERILSRDESTGDYTRLLNFPPGANTTP